MPFNFRDRAREKLLENDKLLNFFFSSPLMCFHILLLFFWRAQVTFIAVTIECWVKWVKSSYLLPKALGESSEIDFLCVQGTEVQNILVVCAWNSQKNTLLQGCICLHPPVRWRISWTGGFLETQHNCSIVEWLWGRVHS